MNHRGGYTRAILDTKIMNKHKHPSKRKCMYDLLVKENLINLKT